MRALADAADRHRLPLGELGTYMRSMRIDCAPVRIGSWDELVAYMDGSAGSVGRIMASLLGVPAGHHADLGRLGLAFQLANFIRDVREDRRLDRVYLPAEDRERFGVTDDDLLAARSTPEVRALLAHEVERARRAVRRRAPRDRVRARLGAPGRAVRDRPVPADARPVESVGFDVLGRRAGVRVWHLPGAALEALR